MFLLRKFDTYSVQPKQWTVAAEKLSLRFWSLSLCLLQQYFLSGNMSLSNVVRHTVILVILILSNASLQSANQHIARKNVNEVTTTRSQPKKSIPKTPQVDHALCKQPIFPILPPGWALPRSLWSVRAMMFLQILPDGTINGTLSVHEHTKLAMEVVDNCSVRIKGVATERYLAMGINGTLVSQIHPDQIRSIFRVQLEKEFFTFKNGDFFIALKHGGTTKKVRGNQNGRSNRRSTRFVLLDRKPRKRRFPSAVSLQRMKDFRPKLFEGLKNH